MVVPVEVDRDTLDLLAVARPELKGRDRTDRKLIGRAINAALREALENPFNDLLPIDLARVVRGLLLDAIRVAVVRYRERKCNDE